MRPASGVRARVLAVATVALVTAGACSAFRQGSTAPHIDTIQPDSVMMPSGAVVEVLLRGHDFIPGTPGRNVVQFGELKISDVPASTDGKEIRLVIPERMPSRGDAAPSPLETGRYSIRVETANGVSNAVTVRVDR
jgi:hypothetical protein